LSSLVASVFGQQIGQYTAEVNPAITWQSCTKSGGCSTVQGSITLDANYRWLHNVGGYTNCKTASGTWNSTICTDPTSCAKDCAVEGVDYSTSGVATSGNALTVTLTTATNSGPRVYLLDPTGQKYEMFHFLNQEFAFDVNLANVGCGMNAALYFSEMDVVGGNGSTYNEAGAKYGTGYCDAQCPSGDNFINGYANMNNTGYCCNEMDIWEANSVSNAFTPHGCLQDGPYQCPSSGCSGQCDGNGCGYNAYGQGAHSFYGAGLTIDTTKTFTVVTQFITDSGTSTGNLQEIRRYYIQNGVTYQNPNSTVGGNSITTAFCSATGQTGFATEGGFTPLTKAFKTGMVLAVSLWDDPSTNGMGWLDMGSAGTCTGGVNTTAATVSATFSNIKFGDIGSTYGSSTTTTTSKSSTTTSKSSTTTSKATTTTTTKTTSTTTSSAAGATQTHYGQCGGIGYTGPTVCASPWTCTYSNPYYSQCL
ncbi:glycoside hydrolase, partial [Clavulina sp. PMI_390]